jgi:hypothetical protein
MTTPQPTTQKPKLSLADTITQLKDLPKQPIRLLLLGAPGEGKTWSALTFPNPIIRNFDNKLTGYQESHPDSNIQVVNFDKELVVDKLGCSNMGFGKPNNPAFPLNVRDAAKKWLTIFGPELTPEQTLVDDSWTSLQNRFDIQSQLPHEISYTKSGEEDKFAFWRMKQKYSGEMTELYKTLRCNVVVICHEVKERNEDGNLTGKLKPLMQGGFADQLVGQFSDAYRQICITKDMKEYESIKKTLGRDINGEREWLWFTKSNALFTACSSVKGLPPLVPATYESLIKKYA